MKIQSINSYYDYKNYVPAKVQKQQYNTAYIKSVPNNLVYFTAGLKPINFYKKYDLNNKNILITGGTGTIGNHLIEDLLRNYSPKNLIIFSRDEMKQFLLRNKYRDYANMQFIIGDVRDENALRKAFSDVDVLIHTAAMKHVPICELNPEEAIKTNINGIRNIIDAVLGSSIRRVLAVSSDKAACPTTLYGATKFAGEKLITDANKYTQETGTRFGSVRLGNVLGSRGSIIPLFKEQSKKGAITVTDENMTRFFMTPQQATELILSSTESMNGGEIFIPKLKNINILKLAKQIAPKAEIQIIGARPGEKLSEEFITSAEIPHTIEIADKYIILPAKESANFENLWQYSRKVPSNLDYSSANEQFLMSSSDLGRLIDQFG